MQRFGQVISLHADGVARCRSCTRRSGPDAGPDHRLQSDQLDDLLRQPENLLFASFEYVGEDFEADMARMAADPIAQKWRGVAMPLQDLLVSRTEGEW